MKRLFLLYSFAALVLGSPFAEAQVTIAFQGFEGSPSDNWGFTPPSQNNTPPIVQVGAGNYGPGYAVTGTGSVRAGGGSNACGNGSANCINGAPNGSACTDNFNGAIVEFAPIDVSCYTGVSLSAAHRSHVSCPGQGQGLDGPDRLFFEIALNGGAWSTQATIQGNANCDWDYTTNPVTCTATPVANPYVYTVPAGTQTVAFRVRIQRDRADEVFYLDDVTLSGTLVPLPPVSIQHIDP